MSDDDEVQCAHCEIIALLSDRLDEGEDPDRLCRDLVQVLADFMAWNTHPGGRATMVAAALTRLPGLVAESVAATDEAKRKRRMLQ